MKGNGSFFRIERPLFLTDVKKAVAQKATAYKGEDKYFISSFVISGRRGIRHSFSFGPMKSVTPLCHLSTGYL